MWHLSVLLSHLTHLLTRLRQLLISQRIQYKYCVLVYRCFGGSAPNRLHEAVHSDWQIVVATSELVVPVTHRLTFDVCASDVTGPRTCQEQPSRGYPPLSSSVLSHVHWRPISIQPVFFQMINTVLNLFLYLQLFLDCVYSFRCPRLWRFTHQVLLYMM